MRIVPLLLIILLASCGRVEREREAAASAAREATIAEVERVLSEADRVTERLAGRAEAILRPMPVMTPAEEDALRRFLGATHVARGRALVETDVHVLERRVGDPRERAADGG